MRVERVLIVGGGIGGMALAAALERLGIEFVLFERAERLGEVGSGLGLLPGAVQGLEELGVGRELFEDAAPFRRFRIASARGRDLAEVDFRKVFERAGGAGYVVHRSDLHAAIATRVDPRAIRLGTQVVGIDHEPGGVRVRLAGHGGGPGGSVRGDLLVGADGLNSVVRSHVLGDGAPRYAGETIFRGVAEHDLADPGLSRELFGRGRRTAYYELGPGRVYWWATAPFPEGTSVAAGDRLGYLERAFAGWAFGITELYRSTPPDAILQNDIYDRRPARRWHHGAAVLLGDAAHPTTPNLGQGACMAIEDAIVLARSIDQAEDCEAAFAAYRSARARRAARTVLLSRCWGAAGLWQSAALARGRDACIRASSSALLERQALAQYGYLPGGLFDPSARSGRVSQ